MAELRNLTEDEKFSLATDALGFGVLDPADQKLTYEIMESAVKKFCEVNGLTLGVTPAPETPEQLRQITDARKRLENVPEHLRALLPADGVAIPLKDQL